MLTQAQALICLSADDDLAMAVMDRAAAEAFSAADPYTQAGLWRQVELNAVKVTFGQL